jgi:hypothetical protein
VLLLLITGIGCVPWEARTRPAPWMAPNTRAVEYIRIHEGIGGGSTAEREWRDAGGRRVSIDDTKPALEKFMHDTGMFSTWPNSPTLSFQGVERLAPLRFVMVSIDPDVILMTPFDFGPPGNRSGDDIVFPAAAAACMRISDMVNPIECDISAVYAPNMLWFSHDLQQQPSPIPWRDGRAELPIRDEVLILTHDGKIVRTERHVRVR